MESGQFFSCFSNDLLFVVGGQGRAEELVEDLLGG